MTFQMWSPKIGWPEMCHSALLWYLSPCFFHCVTIWLSTRKYWAVASFFTVPRFFFASPIPGLHLLISLTRTFCVPKNKGVRGNFCNPCTRLRILGARATHCQQRKRERPNGNTDSKPMVLACVFSLCLRSALAEYVSLQVFHSLVYRVAMLTMSHFTFHHATS